jgi:hypothetical protein
MLVEPEPETLVNLHFTQIGADASSFLPGWEPSKAVDDDFGIPGWHSKQGNNELILLDMGRGFSEE